MPGRIVDSLQGLINARGRSAGHVAEGALICAGAVLLAAVVAARQVGAANTRSPQSPVARAGLASAVWSPLVLVMTLSGLRIWNAPPSRERSRALGLWGAVQLLSAVAALVSPRRRTAQLAAAAGALGAGVGYAASAGKVDAASAALVSPYLGLGSVTGLIGSQLRRHAERRTIH